MTVSSKTPLESVRTRVQNQGMPAVRIQRHSAPRGSFELAIAASRLGLGDYCGYVERGAPVRRREVPHDGYTLILSFGDELTVAAADGSAPGRYTSFLAGLHDRPVVTGHAGVQYGIELRLPPLTAYRLLRRPLAELTNAVVELPELLGPGTDRLVQRLAEAPDWSSRFALLDAEFAARLAGSDRPAAEVAWALGRLRRHHGRLPVGPLAAATGWSQRHFTARFRAQVGMAPKQFARVLRFQHAVTRMRGAPEPCWAEIAACAGYYDQPHLNRDFRELAGCTPTEYLARLLPEGRGVTVPDDAFPNVQDAAALAA